jgi:hypothetical protein
MVLIPLDNFNRTKVDGAAITGVIVTINNDKCTVAVKEGMLKKAYVYHQLGAVPEPSSNNSELMDLEEVYVGWREQPKITEREAAAQNSTAREIAPRISVSAKRLVLECCRGNF